MSHQLIHILTPWFELKDRYQWVLATVYQTQGPCYRKAGAMMLFNSVGQQYGLLSGGCLESDLQRHARKVMQSGQSITVTYNNLDEDDISFQLGIGCGGTVHIMLQLVDQANNYLSLTSVFQCLTERNIGYYIQQIPNNSKPSGCFETQVELNHQSKNAWIEQDSFYQLIIPEPHILIAGGGIDAVPVAAIGQQLGWKISVWDPRPANARAEHFGTQHNLLNNPVDDLAVYVAKQRIDAVIVMTHNLQLDANVLTQIAKIPLKYLALLGPVNRKNQVLAMAQLTEDDFHCSLSSPAGLAIGGELPEYIALSILAQCQAVFSNATI